MQGQVNHRFCAPFIRCDSLQDERSSGARFRSCAGLHFCALGQRGLGGSGFGTKRLWISAAGLSGRLPCRQPKVDLQCGLTCSYHAHSNHSTCRMHEPDWLSGSTEARTTSRNPAKRLTGSHPQHSNIGRDAAQTHRRAGQSWRALMSRPWLHHNKKAYKVVDSSHAPPSKGRQACRGITKHAQGLQALPFDRVGHPPC